MFYMTKITYVFLANSNPLNYIYDAITVVVLCIAGLCKSCYIRTLLHRFIDMTPVSSVLSGHLLFRMGGLHM
jgi:hypothetical protein